MKKFSFIALLLSACVFFSACTPGPQKYSTEFFDVFDTYTSLSGFAASKNEFDKYSQEIHAELLRLHKLFDIYNNYDGFNNLKTINDNAGIQPVKVDSDIIELLVLSKQAYDDSLGTLDVTMGPVLKIWHSYRTVALENPQNAAVPAIAELEKANTLSGIQDLIIDEDNSTVFLARKGMSLDVGAIAKGFSTQKAAELSKEIGFYSGIINTGGNICAIGTPATGKDKWNIGIQSPLASADGSPQIFDEIPVSDCAVVTSGNYQRFYQFNGESFHHIIDPATLFPSNHIAAVTIIHSNSTIADILSTAAFILPYERGKEIVQAMDAEAVWIFPDGSFAATDGYKRNA